MKSRYAGLLILGFSSLTAAAFPHASINQLVQQTDPNCSQTNSNNGLRDLIHKINIPAQADDNGVVPRDASGEIIERDPRGSLLTLGPKLGMSASEIERARQTTGYVICPGTKYNNPAQGSGTLVGRDGMQVLTVAHTFIDENGLFREPLSECYFQNQADSVNFKQTKLNVTSKDVFKLFSQSPTSDAANDLALVRINRRKKLTDTKPFPIDYSGTPLKKGQKLIMISSSQTRMKEVVPATVPVVQGCRMQADLMIKKETNVPLKGIFTDCAGTIGGSGSITLARINGQLTIKGLLVGAGKDVADYLPFNVGPEADENQRSYSYSAEITSGIGEEISSFEAENSKTRTASDDSPTRRIKGDGQGL